MGVNLDFQRPDTNSVPVDGSIVSEVVWHPPFEEDEEED